MAVPVQTGKGERLTLWLALTFVLCGWMLDLVAGFGGLSPPVVSTVICASAVPLLGLLLVRQNIRARTRERMLREERAAVEKEYAELSSAKALADTKGDQLEAILSGMSDGVMMLDANLALVAWNARFCDYTGVPPQALRVGATMEELLRAQALAGEFGSVDVESEVRRRVRQLHAAAGVGTNERRRPNGRTIELRRSLLPGGGFVTLYTDITQRKQAEAAQRAARRLADTASEERMRLVAMVSHEIRSPLNAVVSSLSLLEQSGLTPAQRRIAGAAREAGITLLELVADVMQMTEMEAGQLALRPASVALAPLLESVCDGLRSQAAQRGLSVALEIDPAIPGFIHADGGRLRQVVVNFLSNAAKFSAPGRILVIAAVLTDPAGDRLRLMVQDPGPRIPDADLERLFQPFGRLEGARAAGIPGTGLGLAVCDRLARLMGGEVGAGAASSGGNAFWLSVPLTQAEPPPLASVPPPPAPARNRRASILLVEDVPANHLITGTLLRREGHRVDVAESGLEAVQKAATTPYDLVLMDLAMPGIDGVEAARRIRALPPPAGLVPIVALTANTGQVDRERCMEAGMNAILGKPVQPDDLLGAVGRASWYQPPAVPAHFGGDGGALPLLAHARLADLRKGLPDGLFADLVEQCLADIDRRMAVLRAAAGGEDAAAIAREAHALAGMAGTYGLAAIDARMRGIMALCRTGDLAACREMAAGANSELSASAAAIRAVLAQPETAAPVTTGSGPADRAASRQAG
jgi:signal transduction histidine kinase/DNA-binding NarL/FixJ family response regulator